MEIVVIIVLAVVALGALAFCVLLWQTVRRQTAEMASARGEREQAAKELSDLKVAKATVDAELEGIEARYSSQIESLEKSHTDLLETERRSIREQREALQEERKSFEKQLNDFLKAQTSDVVRQALEDLEKRAEKEFENKSDRIDKLVEPLSKNLDELRKKTEKYEETVVKMERGLEEQIKHMMDGAERLNRALSKPHVRGSWGEIQLEVALEAAGLVKGLHFETQFTTKSNDSLLRPDAVIKLSNDRKLVVDSKLSLEDFVSAQAATDDEDRRRYLERHASSVKRHIEQLSKKEYRDAVEGVDFVVMFVPAESIYFAAFEMDRNLIQYAQERNVILANPMTLLTIFQCVAQLNRLAKASEESEQIRKLATELCDRLGTFGGHFLKVGSGLRQAMENYNRSATSFESQLFTSAQRIQELGIRAKATDVPTEIEIEVREFVKVDLLRSIEEARDVNELPEPQEPECELPEALLEDD